MHVLHITGWYANAIVPHEAPFIGRHIASLAPHASNTVWHIDVRPGTRNTLHRQGPQADRTYLVTTTTRRWLIIEWVATLLILWAWLTRDRSKSIDIVNFHIAYPNCTRIRLLRWIMRKPMVITEHFSAYRVGYNAKSKGVRRIKNIFHTGVPVIVVSRSLQGDIERFAGEGAQFHVIDNAVDPAVFHYDPAVAPEPGRYLMVAGWRIPKRPDVMLDALAALRSKGIVVQLRMAGEGAGLVAIKERIAKLSLQDDVVLLGQLNEQQVADEMRKAQALVHASDYETYSAVCAEALSCGTPVIASRVGGIPEFVSADMGVLVADNSVGTWAHAWRDAVATNDRFNRKEIATRMQARAGMAAVGTRYHAILQQVIASAHVR